MSNKRELESTESAAEAPVLPIQPALFIINAVDQSIVENQTVVIRLDRRWDHIVNAHIRISKILGVLN